MIIGTCSICGGPVMVPDVCWSTIPPTPQCTNCGAYKKNGYGPVIEMEKAETKTTATKDVEFLYAIPCPSCLHKLKFNGLNTCDDCFGTSYKYVYKESK